MTRWSWYALNFLAIFFINYLFPGIEVMKRSKWPELQGEIPFALILGGINAFLYPFLKKFDPKLSLLRMAVASVFLNFFAYALLKILPLEIEIQSWMGYLLIASTASIISFATQFFQKKGDLPEPPKMDLML